VDRNLNILFVHQNFPAQFKRLSVALAEEGHQVVALGTGRVDLPGVTVIPYRYLRSPSASIHPLAREYEVKAIRGEAVGNVCLDLREKGFTPDLIYVHPGWGEALFLRDIYPRSKIVVYCEYFYNLEGQDVNFDPEFPAMGLEEQCRLRMKNTCNLHALEIGDAFVAPTRWQKRTYPKRAQRHIQVIHDGLDFEALEPDSGAVFESPALGLRLEPEDRVVTFVSRNLEPMRGIHSFLRCLPAVLRELSDARVLVFGGEAVGYGSMHASGRPWREVFLEDIQDKRHFDRVYFPGRTDYRTYLDALQVSSAHVYLTYPFLVSWSMLEAMFVGASVIGSDTGPVAEFLPAAQRTDFFDVEGLARKIVRAVKLDSPAARTARAEKVRSRHRGLALDTCLASHRTLLRGLVG